MRRSLLAAAVVLAAVAASPAPSAAHEGARLSVRFDHGARLGQPTALRFGLRIDPRRWPAPIAGLKLRYPLDLGMATSGLGLAACRPPVRDFELVLVDGRLSGLGGCPINSVMGHGDARALVRVGTLKIPATAYLTVLAGPVTDGRLGLVTYVTGINPFGMRLAYSGAVAQARPAAEELAIAFPEIPGIPEDARWSLTNVTIAIGSRRVVYRDRNGARYRPDGILLPDRCSGRGFRFHAQLAFQDGTSTTASTTTGCPRRGAQRSHASSGSRTPTTRT